MTHNMTKVSWDSTIDDIQGKLQRIELLHGIVNQEKGGIIELVARVMARGQLNCLDLDFDAVTL